MEERKLLHYSLAFVFTFFIHFFITLHFLSYVRPPGIFIQIIFFLIEVKTIFILTKRLKTWSRMDWILLTFFYFLTLSYMLLGRSDMGIALTELDPLQWIRSLYWGSTDEMLFAFFNVISFIPMPFLIGHWFNSPFTYTCSCFLVSMGFEILQFLTKRGVFDIGDILLYWFGIMIGAIITHFILKKSLFI